MKLLAGFVALWIANSVIAKPETGLPQGDYLFRRRNTVSSTKGIDSIPTLVNKLQRRTAAGDDKPRRQVPSTSSTSTASLSPHAQAAAAPHSPPRRPQEQLQPEARRSRSPSISAESAHSDGSSSGSSRSRTGSKRKSSRPDRKRKSTSDKAESSIKRSSPGKSKGSSRKSKESSSDEARRIIPSGIVKKEVGRLETHEGTSRVLASSFRPNLGADMPWGHDLHGLRLGSPSSPPDNHVSQTQSTRGVRAVSAFAQQAQAAQPNPMQTIPQHPRMPAGVRPPKAQDSASRRSHPATFPHPDGIPPNSVFTQPLGQQRSRSQTSSNQMSEVQVVHPPVSSGNEPIDQDDLIPTLSRSRSRSGSRNIVAYMSMSRKSSESERPA